MHARGAPIVCLANTATGREREYAIRPAAARRRIVVVGGGPAGLESARVLALRGHSVTLFEREREPGGQLLLSRLVPGREELAGHIPWLVGEGRRAGVRFEMGVEATAAMALAENPDLIVVATGASVGLPAIPGILDSPVVDAYEVLRRPMGGTGRALVIGGGIRGVGVARVLADKGIEVVLVEVGRELATDIASRSRRFQVGALLERPNVTVHLGTTVEALGEHDAVLWNGTERLELANIGLVVPTRMLLPVTRVSDDLYAGNNVPPIFLLGDCAQPRTALEAMHDAAALGHRI
jgi:NADPH-dependent 2,4-dienoyl-CoA reductase/sulfur reductase-like enzyme